MLVTLETYRVNLKLTVAQTSEHYIAVNRKLVFRRIKRSSNYILIKRESPLISFTSKIPD